MRRSKPRFRIKAKQAIPDSTERLSGDQDGIRKSGTPLRGTLSATPVPWNWKQTTLPDGQTVVSVVGPFSPDTLTTVRYEYALIESDFSQAIGVIRQDPNVSNANLRKICPRLGERFSDRHFQKIKDSEESGEPKDQIKNLKWFFAEVLKDEVPQKYEADTFYYYLTHKDSRQIKKAARGRPRK